MSIFDTILLLAWSGFVFYGLFFGFIRLIGNFVGMIVGVFLASRFYLEFYESFNYLFGSNVAVGKVLSFLILYGIISKLVGIGITIIEKIFNILTIIPFLKSFNRIGGVILGFFLGGIIIGLTLYLSSKHFLTDSLFASYLADSKLSPILMYFSNLVKPLLPEVVKAMKSLI